MLNKTVSSNSVESICSCLEFQNYKVSFTSISFSLFTLAKLVGI